MYSKKCVYLERDILILRFLWSWKVATTSTIYEMFFKERSPITAYYRLKTMADGGFIRCLRTPERGFNYWTLDEKGFLIAKDQLSKLKEEGYASEAPRHDLLVAAVQIGDWVRDWPAHGKVCTEQQLRRYYPEFLPAWIPELPSRRPDGLWHLKRAGCPPMTIALEVELSRQNRAHYEDVAHIYGAAKWIDRVLWVVEKPQLARALEHTFAGIKHDRVQAIHNIVLVEDFMRMGWMATIKSGPEKEKSISELLNDQTVINKRSIGHQSVIPSQWRALLDKRKRPKNQGY